MRKIQLNHGVCLHIENTNKFKDVTVSVRFLTPFTKECPTLRSLLGMMLVDRTGTYDTKLKLQKQLDYLYGANLYYKVTGYGKGHVLEIKSQVLNERYTKQSLLKEQFELLYEVLENPLLNETTFQEAKRILKEKFERLLDTPSSYASKKLLEEGAKGDTLSIHAAGDLDVIEKVTLEDVKNEYTGLLHKNQIDIFVIGDVNEEEVIALCNEYFHFTSNQEFDSFYKIQLQEYAMSSEKKDIQQSILSVLYRTGITIQDEDYWTLRVLNGMFGAFPTSYLFQEVREKRSLCYSIYSSIIAYDGALVVQTGIDVDKVDLVLSLIQEQLQHLQKHEFTDELVVTTKEMLKNGLLTIEDSVSSLIGLGYQNRLLHNNQSLTDFIAGIDQVSSDDLIRVANQLQLQYTFVLEQENVNEEEL